ncbi:hypothetical protein [Mariniradius sediminis]|uniref:Outer membrane protein beta-barrel domain-containing protein n=1 Tax=Mariniradius sediminis TaxID=2909237 RepID=A0ABS9C016_9BACT|nr:hypothetical protein [Mariniradius sediminis]MCF1753270.1 hypothetical protein [Mariniradius sediminis]
MSTIKITLLTAVLLIYSDLVFGQKAELGFSLGFYGAPSERLFENPQTGASVNLGLFYRFHEDWTIGSSINISNFDYFRLSAIGTPIIGTDLPLDGSVQSDHISFIVNRRFELSWGGMVAEGGFGMGALVEKNFFYVPISFDEETGFYRGFSGERSTTVNLHVPLRMSIFKPFGEKGSIGLEGYMFVDPKGFVRGMYFGPRIAFGI